MKCAFPHAFFLSFSASPLSFKNEITDLFPFYVFLFSPSSWFVDAQSINTIFIWNRSFSNHLLFVFWNFVYLTSTRSKTEMNTAVFSHTHAQRKISFFFFKYLIRDKIVYSVMVFLFLFGTFLFHRLPIFCFGKLVFLSASYCLFIIWCLLAIIFLLTFGVGIKQNSEAVSVLTRFLLLIIYLFLFCFILYSSEVFSFILWLEELRACWFPFNISSPLLVTQDLIQFTVLI